MKCSVKQPELDGTFLKHGMQVQTMIPTAVIMLVTAACSAIPDAFHTIQGFRFLSVQLMQKTLFYRLTPAMLAGY